MQQDILIEHPRIYLDASGLQTHALFVRDGRVVAIGDDALAAAPADARHMTPDAACLFPALTDAHLHVWGLGQRVGLVDLRATKSPEEIYAALPAAPGSDSGWIEGHGWDQHSWPEGARLSLARLDEMFPDTPVCLRRVDHHAGWVNSEALRRAGLLDVTSIDGGAIERDDRGHPTGLLVDAAIEQLTDAIPEESDAELEAVYRQNAQMLRGFGITCAHMAWTDARGLRMAQRLWREGTAPIRIWCMIDANDARLDELRAEGPWRDPDGQIAWACIKYFADGAMGSKGALMLEPYLDGTTGLVVTSRERMLDEFPSLVEQGWQIAVHAIGDAGARNVLDAFELALSRHTPSAPLRLEHAQIMAPDDISRLGALGVVASAQPIHMFSDSPWAHRVLTDAQLERLYNWRELGARTILCGGSDFPIDDVNPWHGIATFVSRRNSAGDLFRPDQAIDIHAALAAYTSEAAAAAGWGEVLGALRPGFVADVIALDADPFECTDEQLWGMSARVILG